MAHKQHRISAHQYAQGNTGLFRDPGSPSQLLALREHCQEISMITHRRSLTSDTERTLVNSPVLSQKELENSCESQSSTPALGKQHPGSSIFTVIEDDKQLDDYFLQEANFEAYIIEQKHSYARLNVTASMFESLCSHAKIFPQFKDMLIYMGERNREIEVAPPRPRWRYLRSETQQGYEVTYGLRWIEANDRSEKWSLRQSMIYNRLNIRTGTSSWILAGHATFATEDLHNFIESGAYRNLDAQPRLHLAFIESSILCWRPYLVFLTEEIGKHSNDIKCANPKDAEHLAIAYVDLAKTGTRLELKILEDQVTDAMLSLEANRDAITSLAKILILRDKPTSAVAYYESVREWEALEAVLDERIRDIDMLLRQLGSLQTKLMSCTHIVSGFSQLSNGLSLQKLTKAAQEETEQATILTRRAQRDGAAVKALTVITLVYLPTTVVLNFFSASFIDTAHGEMVLVGRWWLFLIICLPLTAITICAWQLWVRRQSRQQNLADEERSAPPTLAFTKKGLQGSSYDVTERNQSSA